MYPTTNHLCSTLCIFGTILSLQDALVKHQGAPELGDVPSSTIYICKYPCSIMFRRYGNDLHSNYHREARNRVERGTFSGHLQIAMIRL